MEYFSTDQFIRDIREKPRYRLELRDIPSKLEKFHIGQCSKEHVSHFCRIKDSIYYWWIRDSEWLLIRLDDIKHPKTFRYINDTWAEDEEFLYTVSCVQDYGAELLGDMSCSADRQDNLDKKTFMFLWRNALIYKDKNWVYLFDRKLPWLDPVSFHILWDSCYGGDINGIYYWICNGEVEKLVNVDPLDFRLIWVYGYWKSNNTVFFEGKVIEGIDAKSLGSLWDSYYVRDINWIYIGTGKLNNIDPKSFEIFEHSCYALWEIYGKDRNWVYIGAKEIIGADSASFEILANSCYARDKYSIYWKWIRMNLMNIKDFMLLWSCFGSYELQNFGKDNTWVYMGNAKLAWADPETFRILGNFCYGKDKQNIYWQWRTIVWADYKSFKSLWHGEAIDKRYHYSEWELY